MFEVLTGALPAEGIDVLAALARTEWDAELSSLVASALSRAAAGRPTARELADDLRAVAVRLHAPPATSIVSSTSTRAAVEAATLRDGG